MARRPLDGDPPISCNDACHKARKSAGGTDYAVPEGTPVYAPFSGTLSIGHNSSAGDYTTILSPTGVRVYLDHLKERGVTRGWVNEGDDIARTGGRPGAPYSGSATGPHLHADMREDGKVLGMEEWLAEQPDWAGDGGTPIGGIVLDQETKDWFNGLGNAIIEGTWRYPLTHSSGVVGPAGDWLMNTAAQVTEIRDSLAGAPTDPATGGPSTDAIVAALKPLFDALPAQVRTKIIAPE